MVRLISIFIILLITSVSFADGRYCGLVEWIFSIETSGPLPRPEPNPTPSPYKCKYCKDTKVIVHGDGHTTPCPHCSQRTPVEKPTPIIFSADYQYIKIDGVWKKRKPAMAGTGRWIGIDLWSRCMGSYCTQIKITDEKQLGFDPEDY